jgi:small-conductance mechanosensitive channel
MLWRMIRVPSSLFLVALLSLAPGARAGEPDLATPRRALRLFIDSARAGDFDKAARALDLRALPEPEQARRGPRLARQLKFVLDQKLWIDWDKIPDAPQGSGADGRGIEVVGVIPLDSDRVAVRLVRSADGSWQIGPGVVAAVPRLYRRFGPGWLGDRVPPVLLETVFLDLEGWQWLGLLAGLALALFSALVLGTVARRIALRVARGTRFSWDDRLVEAASGPGRLLLGIATMGASVRALHLAVPAQEVMDHLLRMSSVILFTWAGLRAVRFAAEVLGERIAQEGDGPEARTRLTQIMVLRRIAGFVVMVVGGALVLLQFDALRAVGTSLLASAGVAGIVIGFAAQRSIATLLAGLQISMTQPVRVGDVVVIEGEWGTIEEITLTYVVVKIWDLRRLVVPMTRILDSPFQNWTRAGSDILGTVFLHADYRVPVDALRQELKRFVKDRPEWDGKVVGVQVTDATNRTIELRALVSSADSSLNWDLRCAVREHLLGFLQRLDGGAYLPRVRVDPPIAHPARNVAGTPHASTAGGAPTAPDGDARWPR